MSSYLITGCNRGLGLSLVKQLLSFPASTVASVYATSRSADPGDQLRALASESGGRLRHVALEVTSSDSIKQAVAQITKAQGAKGLDVLLHNAGVQDKVPKGAPEALSADEFQRVFDTNVMAPHCLTQACLPLLRQGKDKRIVFVSSTVGSSVYNQRGVYDMSPSPAYKVTKATLNALMLQWNYQLKPEGFTVKSLSPGWLQTDLGGAYATLHVDQGAKAVLEIVMEEGQESTGRFRNIKVDGVSEAGMLPYDGADAPF